MDANDKIQPIWTAQLAPLLDKARTQLLGTNSSGDGGAGLTTDALWPYSTAQNVRDFNEVMKRASQKVEAHFGIQNRIVPTSSGTAAIEVALGGLQIPAGSEVIVTPITDPGSVTPILFHNAIPVFADVDPDSGLITPDTVAAVLTSRTSAIIAVHLTGSPVDVPGIRKMLAAKGRPDVKIIEDVAQGLGATLGGVPLGMLGDVGCFSLNAQKHITVGEGGFVLAHNEDDFLRCHNLSDKHRNRFGYQGPNTEHERYEGAGHSMRMSTLQGAMLLAQWDDLPGIVLARRLFGAALGAQLQATSNLVPQNHLADADPAFFGFMFRTAEPVGRKQKSDLSNEVRARPGMSKFAIKAAYTDNDRPIYAYPLFQKRSFPGKYQDIWAAELLADLRDPMGGHKRYDYTKVSCPNTEYYLQRTFWLDVKQDYTPADAGTIADAIVDVFVNAGVALRRP